MSHNLNIYCSRERIKTSLIETQSLFLTIVRKMCDSDEEINALIVINETMETQKCLRSENLGINQLLSFNLYALQRKYYKAVHIEYKWKFVTLISP